MAGTTISELGKMFNQSTQSVQGTESNTRITTGKVDFGSMMKQSGNRQTASYAGIDHNETVKTAANGSKDTVKAADDYQKYQYKDNTIASEIKQVTSEDVVKEQFEQFTEDVKEVLKEELGVSDEAIEAAMQTLGLQFQDLLNQNNLANLVAELTGAEETGIGAIPYPPGAVMNLCADTESLKRDTGFVPEYTFEEGIRETIDWIRSQETGV